MGDTVDSSTHWRFWTECDSDDVLRWKRQDWGIMYLVGQGVVDPEVVQMSRHMQEGTEYTGYVRP